MQPEQAAFMLQMLTQAIEGEYPVTRKVIAAIPEEKVAYKPHEKSMSALELAWPIASAEVWFFEKVVAKRRV